MIKQIKRALSLALALMMVASVAFAQEATSLKDDFYQAVNEAWLNEAEIPADAPSVSAFTEIEDRVEAVLKADTQAMLSGEMEVGEGMVDFIEFYRLAADYETRDALGAEPIEPYLDRIEGLDSLTAFDEALPELTLDGIPLPFYLTVSADFGDASVNSLYFMPAGLFLSVKDYYLDDDTRTALQDIYGQMSQNLLVMAGKTEEEAQQIVAQALAFDENLAAYMRTVEEDSDVLALYNPQSFAELDAQVACVDLTAAAEALLGEVPETVTVTHPEFAAGLNELINDETFPQMKSWMVVQLVNGLAPYLSDAFRVEATVFQRALNGVEQPSTREDDAYNLAVSTFDEVVGVYYGRTYFGEEARADVRDMVEELVDVYKRRLEGNSWLSEETREMAIRKLDTMSIRVGYPDEPSPYYDRIHTVPASEGGTLVGNVMAFHRVTMEYIFSLYGEPVDRSEWPLSAQTVNAVYAAQDNSITFPAAILQEPFYSQEQSASANYGAVGAVIAHEISHAFDPNGAKFDENGSMSNWWTQEDLEKFETLSQAMVEEFDGLETTGGTVNGALTVSENVADAGGLSCALEALKRTEEEPDLEAFFTSWARVWRTRSTDAYAAMLLTVDEHAPAKLRANIQLQNLDDFFTTFGIEEGDGMYRAPEDRVSIW